MASTKAERNEQTRELLRSFTVAETKQLEKLLTKVPEKYRLIRVESLLAFAGIAAQR